MALDKTSPIPLYYQLVEIINEQIRAGDLAPGDRIMPERQLSERYGISRMTTRQAIGYLVDGGALVVRQGLGTYVAEPKMARDMLHLLGFTEEMMQRGGVATSRVLEQKTDAPSPSAAARLGLGDGELVTRLVRLRLLNGVPMLLETTLVPHGVAPGLEREDMAKQSLYRVLEQRYGVRLVRAQQTLEAVVANASESELLGVAPGAPLFLLESLTSDERGRPIELVKTVYRGDRFSFTFESERAVLHQTPQPISMTLASHNGEAL